MQHSDDWNEQVQRRAYLIWEAEGRPEGRSDEFWHRAAEELRVSHKAELAQEQPKAPTRASARRKTVAPAATAEAPKKAPAKATAKAPAKPTPVDAKKPQPAATTKPAKPASARPTPLHAKPTTAAKPAPRASAKARQTPRPSGSEG